MVINHTKEEVYQRQEYYKRLSYFEPNPFIVGFISCWACCFDECAPIRVNYDEYRYDTRYWDNLPQYKSIPGVCNCLTFGWYFCCRDLGFPVCQAICCNCNMCCCYNKPRTEPQKQ